MSVTLRYLNQSGEASPPTAYIPITRPSIPLATSLERSNHQGRPEPRHVPRCPRSRTRSIVFTKRADLAAGTGLVGVESRERTDPCSNDHPVTGGSVPTREAVARPCRRYHIVAMTMRMYCEYWAMLVMSGWGLASVDEGSRKWMASVSVPYGVHMSVAST
jgi:hypothetical protein